MWAPAEHRGRGSVEEAVHHFLAGSIYKRLATLEGVRVRHLRMSPPLYSKAPLPAFLHLPIIPSYEPVRRLINGLAQSSSDLSLKTPSQTHREVWLMSPAYLNPTRMIKQISYHTKSISVNSQTEMWISNPTDLALGQGKQPVHTEPWTGSLGWRSPGLWPQRRQNYNPAHLTTGL